MNLSLFLFLIGILGFILNRKNIILMIISIEIMLLAVTLLVLISSFSFDDGLGQTFSVFIISIAGAESVIGLSILVAFYRSFGKLNYFSSYLLFLFNKLFNKFTKDKRTIKKDKTFVKIVNSNTPFFKVGYFLYLIKDFILIGQKWLNILEKCNIFYLRVEL
jgi:NADH-ubiquinone oxidoreductase chain 4L